MIARISNPSTNTFPTEATPLVAYYLLFLIEKIKFHHRHQEFDGDFSLEKYRSKTKNAKIGASELYALIDILCHRNALLLIDIFTTDFSWYQR